jgi:hypothetical protein
VRGSFGPALTAVTGLSVTLANFCSNFFLETAQEIQLNEFTRCRFRNVLSCSFVMLRTDANRLSVGAQSNLPSSIGSCFGHLDPMYRIECTLPAEAKSGLRALVELWLLCCASQIHWTSVTEEMSFLTIPIWQQEVCHSMKASITKQCRTPFTRMLSSQLNCAACDISVLEGGHFTNPRIYSPGL